jgi:hypothetical protein
MRTAPLVKAPHPKLFEDLPQDTAISQVLQLLASQRKTKRCCVTLETSGYSNSGKVILFHTPLRGASTSGRSGCSIPPNRNSCAKLTRLGEECQKVGKHELATT